MSAVVRFRSLLNDETEDLYNLCKEWTKVLKFTDVTDEVAGKIHSVVGLTQLLMNEKFKHFLELLELAEKNEEPLKITNQDLEGYWELVRIQVSDLKSKFNSLQTLKQNNWQEPFTERHMSDKRMPLITISNSRTQQSKMLQPKRNHSAEAKLRLAEVKARLRKAVKEEEFH